MGQGRLAVSILISITAACTSEVVEEGDDEPEIACADPKYGNGTCDLELSCEVVDVDCFVTFDTPAAAKGWYDGTPASMFNGASLPPTDPRFAPTQALLDEGWEVYKSRYEVGDLADERVQLILVENPMVNAFVLADNDRTRAGLAVLVNTGLVDSNSPKDQVLGLIMHELAHAIGLHVNQTVRSGMITYYKAPAGAEPIGNAQTDDPAVRAAFGTWNTYAEIGGYMSDAELGGFPLTTSDVTKVALYGYFGVYFFKLVAERHAQNPTTACTAAVNAFVALNNKLAGYHSTLDLGFTVPSSEGTAIVNTITALRSDCFTGVTGDAIAHLARLMGVPDPTLRSVMPPELLAEVEGKTVITGWYNVIRVARERMRAIEAAFGTQLGVPWTGLRYFSTEESADDTSALIMKAMNLAPDGMGQLFIRETGLSTSCGAVLASGATPHYGENLKDDHHATCWRARHQQVIATMASSRRLPTWRKLGPATHRGSIERLAGTDDIPLQSH
jgi:hypothetical protein